MALGGRLASARQKVHAAIQAGYDIPQRETSKASGGEFDRERKPVQPATQGDGIREGGARQVEP
ncbi:MAG TPA: hypothetical protein VIM39_03810, partial [Candidatus Limnocylindrales bacterium]